MIPKGVKQVTQSTKKVAERREEAWRLFILCKTNKTFTDVFVSGFIHKKEYIEIIPDICHFWYATALSLSILSRFFLGTTLIFADIFLLIQLSNLL